VVLVKVRGLCFFLRGSALLSEVRAVKTPAAGRQPKHGVSHLPFVECVASCTSSRYGTQAPAKDHSSRT